MNTWGDEPPAGARQADNAAPAGFKGGEFLARYKAATARKNAALRRGARRRKDGGYRPGMARRPPPAGDDAA